MPTYKKILSAYLNDSKNGQGKYLAITNHSEQQIVIEPGQKLFMNMTPISVREKNPKVPLFSKQIKIEDEPQFNTVPDITDEIPF